MARIMIGSNAPHFPAALRLVVENLTVRRGGRRVLAHLGFALAGGAALVAAGRNGAGKSTLLRAVAGLLPREAGRIALLGAAQEEAEISTAAHFLAHADGLKAALSVEENLDFWGRYLAADAAERGASIEAALQAVGLSHARAAPFGALSAGQKRRAALARLLVARRPLWLLDEPMTALDAASRLRFAAVMRAHLAQGGLILAATHEPLGLEEAALLKLDERPAAGETA